MGEETVIGTRGQIGTRGRADRRDLTAGAVAIKAPVGRNLYYYSGKFERTGKKGGKKGHKPREGKRVISLYSNITIIA
ncbi:MAG: hypothetical protein JWL69_2507 [Phycisphaerales bacterium]|nr:hypothetical protein [Phycisphaerales bacterium]